MGKTGLLPISFMKFKDNALHGKECQFQREGGKLIQLIVEGKQLYPPATPSSTSSPPSITSSKHRKSTRNPSRQQKKVTDSLAIKKTFLCKNIQELVVEIEQADIDNFALKFNKAARYDERMQKFQFFKRERKGENYEIKPHYGDFDFEALQNRQG